MELALRGSKEGHLHDVEKEDQATIYTKSPGAHYRDSRRRDVLHARVSETVIRTRKQALAWHKFLKMIECDVGDEILSQPTK